MLVGRASSVAELARLLADDRPVVVTGEAGVGKTALLRAVATASGRRVAEGGALSTLTWMDHLPLERALGRPVRGADSVAGAADVEGAVGGGVLLLDDLQWADAATLDVVTRLAGRIGLLLAVRRGEPASDAVLDRLRGAGVAEVAVPPLDADDAAAVVRELRPDLSPSTVQRVVSRTGGNPLLLRELTASGEPTASLRLAIAARLRHLDEPGREAFQLLALAGRPMSVDALGAAGVKSLLGADLVVAVGGDEVQVRHALLAEVAIEQLGDADRRERHARIARAVADDGEAARHFALAGEHREACAAALRAAAAADRPGERASHLAIAAENVSGSRSDELRLRAARALDQALDWDGLLRILGGLGTEDREVTAWGHLLRARGAWNAGDIAGLRQALAAGLDLVRGSGTEIEVRLLIENSRIPIFVDVDLEEGVRVTAAALDLSRSTGVDVPRAEYLHGTALTVADRPGADAHLRSAIERARAVQDTTTEFLAANNLIAYHESSGDPAAGRALCEEFIGRARDLGLGKWEQGFQFELALLRFHAGDYPTVLATAEDLIDVTDERRARDGLVELLCMTLIDVGRIDEARRRAAAATFSPDYRGTIQAEWIAAEAGLWAGEPAAALEHAERVLSLDEADPNIELFRVSRAWALADLGRDPGPAGPEHPRIMLKAVRPETAALQLWHRGDHPGAADAFGTAAQRWAPFHRRGELRCLWAAAEALRRTGDTPAAVAALEAVELRVQQHGMLPLLARVHRSLRACGVQRSAPRTRTPGDLLTGRQRQVLALVTEGLTNAQIAHRLGISRHTVVSQITSAVVTLGARSRTHAAALATTGTG